MSTTDRGQVKNLINELREAMQGEDVTHIRNLIEQLQQATNALSQQLYQAQQSEAGPESNGRQPTEEGEDDVVEGEFQEM
jgi:hypothetical protein